MFPRHRRLRALSLSLFLVSLIARVAAEQAPPGQSVRDGLVRSELSLGGRTAILAYAPDLKANDPAHQALLTAAPGAANARVRIGQLETTGVLRIATVQLGKEGQAGDSIKYELWLKGASDGWQVEVIDTAKTVVGQFPLSRHAGAPASPNLVAALVPEDGTISRLVLRWGEYRATSDVEFANLLSRRIESPENRMPNVTVSRAHDEDTSVLSRARLLAQRNESAFVLPKGPRLSVSFQRTDRSGDRSANQGTRRPRGLWVDGPDFARLMKTPDGEVVMLTESPVPRLRIEAPLRFGKASIQVGNHVPNFPGLYGIWLKRVGSGWRLVFNKDADVWGSQHDPQFDVAEVDLKHIEGQAASRPFAVGIEPTASDRGRLLIVWGPHEWSADFVVAG